MITCDDGLTIWQLVYKVVFFRTTCLVKNTDLTLTQI